VATGFRLAGKQPFASQSPTRRAGNGSPKGIQRTIGVLVGLVVALLAMVGTQPAFAGDRPAGVAFVKADPIVKLYHGGSTLVRVKLPKGFGPLKRGNATISSQFLVNNAEAGDPAGGHGITQGWIKPV
jgi:hypothetical protein